MGQHYEPEVKAQVMAALLAGQSVSSAAKEYDIPKGTLSNWRRKATDKQNGVLGKRTQKDNKVGELLLRYLETNLTTLDKQAEFFGDEAWLKKQTASDAAVLHGVMTDKSVRLLEAMSASATNDTTPND